ncbi:hypothetical protein [Arthrobacter sp. M4]|uniref:hypothetical protein n=1 Tax=Arthrobacter sp. M4 TaxID=218160 RepID=UPI001CDBC742|nr:hypothetical protein [Arthrobacter sp. M4]MCA4134121.1 hypothetical protein [Arthrobacter sp. M4]
MTAWTRETAKQLRLSPTAIRWFAAAALAAALAFGTLLAVMSNGQTEDQAPVMTAGTLSFMMAGSFLTVAFLTALFSMLAPAKNSLATVLELLPASRGAVLLGLQLPILAVSAVLALCLTLPSYAALWRNSTQWGQALAASAALVLFTAGSQLLVLALFQCLRYVYRRFLRLPRYYAVSFAGTTCFGLTIALVWTDVLPIPSSMADHANGLRDLAPHRVWARSLALLWSASSAGWTDYALILLWLVVPLVLILTAARRDFDNQADSTLRTFANASLPRQRFATAAYVDAVQLLRSQQFMVLLLLITVALAGLVLLSKHEGYGVVAFTLAPGLATAPFILGLQSYGLTAKTHWLQRHLYGSRTAWAGPKLVASAVISLTIGSAFAGVLFGFGLLTLEQLPQLLGDAAIAWCAASIGGILVPFSTEQPLASGATGFTVFLIYAASLAVARWTGPKLGALFGDAPYLGDVIITSMMLLVLAGALASTVYRVSQDG